MRPALFSSLVRTSSTTVLFVSALRSASKASGPIFCGLPAFSVTGFDLFSCASTSVVPISPTTRSTANRIILIFRHSFVELVLPKQFLQQLPRLVLPHVRSRPLPIPPRHFEPLAIIRHVLLRHRFR